MNARTLIAAFAVLAALATGASVADVLAEDEPAPRGPRPARAAPHRPPPGGGTPSGAMLMRAADADRDGVVSKDEWSAFLAKLEPGEDGTLDMEKLAAALRPKPSEVAARIRRAFGKKADEAVTLNDVKRTFSGLDANEDGDVDAHEMPQRRRGRPGGRGPMRDRPDDARPDGAAPHHRMGADDRPFRGPPERDRRFGRRDFRGPGPAGRGPDGAGPRERRARDRNPPMRGPRGQGPRGPRPDERRAHAGPPGPPRPPPPRDRSDRGPRGAQSDDRQGPEDRRPPAGRPAPPSDADESLARRIDRLTTALEKLLEKIGSTAGK